MIVQRDCPEQPFHRGTRLEGILHRRIMQARITAMRISIGQRQHFPGKRIQHHRRAAARTAAGDFLRQVILRRRLDRRIDRQFQPRPRLRAAQRQR